MLLLLASGCQSTPELPLREPGPFDWTLGTWEGARRDGADGHETPMHVRVEPILDGRGQIEHLEVGHADSVYRGFSVQVFDRDLDRQIRQYVNSSRGRFVRLEGEIGHDRCVWRTVAPQRTRESRLVSERTADDVWRRTMSISTDGGEIWRVLWMDELQRVR